MTTPNVEFDPATGLIKTPSGPTSVVGSSHNDVSSAKSHTLVENTLGDAGKVERIPDTPVTNIPPTVIPGATGSTNPRNNDPVTGNADHTLVTDVAPTNVVIKKEPESPNPPTASTRTSTTVEPAVATHTVKGESFQLSNSSEKRLNRQQKLYVEIQEVLKEYGNLESNIPVTHNYWALLNEYRSLR